MLYYVTYVNNTCVVLYNMTHVMSCVMLYHVIMLLYNIDVLTELKYRCSNRTEQNMLYNMCHVMLCYITYVMLCYIT